MFPWFFVILVALCRCLCIWRNSPLLQTLWAEFSKGGLLPAVGGTLGCWVKGWHRVQGENLCNLQGDCAEICWRAGHCGPWSLLLCGCYWQPLLFFLVPRYFYTSQLFWSGRVEANMGHLCSIPKGRGSWLLTLLFSSWWGELFAAGKFPSDPEQCPFGGWSQVGKMGPKNRVIKNLRIIAQEESLWNLTSGQRGGWSPVQIPALQ